MTIKETNITINVREMDASVAFYTSIGMTVKQRWGNYYAQLIAPGLTIGLHPTQDSINASGSGNVSIGFTTEDFEEVEAHLKSLGIDILIRKEDGGQFIHFNDPDGTSLYFINPK